MTEDVKQTTLANLFQALVTEHAIAKPDSSSRFFKIGSAAALAMTTRAAGPSRPLRMA